MNLLCITDGMLLAFTKGSCSLWIDPRCARPRYVLATTHSKEDNGMALNYIYHSDSLDVLYHCKMYILRDTRLELQALLISIDYRALTYSDE